MTSARSRPAPTPGLHKAALVAFGLALAFGALAALEGGLRLFGIGDEVLFGDPFVGFAAGRDLFERDRLPDGTEVYSTAAEKLAYFNHQQFPVAKGPDAYRIFSLGGSTTAGRPYDHAVSFSAFLQLYLDGMQPDREWEVINAGAISYASYRVVLLMKELIRYEPDLFVVYTGHNEFLEDRAYPPIIHRSLAAKRVWIWLNGLRTYSLGQRWVRTLRGPSKEGSSDRARLASEVAAKPDDWTGMKRYRRDQGLRESIIEHFEYNLHQMVAIARSAGADVVFVKPVSNLKDFSPFKSEPTPGLDPEALDRVEGWLAEAARLAGGGDSPAALPFLERAAALDPANAEVRFRLGRAYFELGRESEARAEFVRAKDEDVAPLRALEPIVELVGTTGERLGIPTLDLPAVLAVESRSELGHGIPGNEFFLDHVHPDIPVHSRIAEEILALLVDEDIVRPSSDWSDGRRRAIFEGVLDSLDRTYYAERDLNLAKVLGWAGKTAEAEEPLRRAAEILVDNPEVHLNLGIVLVKLKRWSEAYDAVERSLTLDPDSPKAHFNLGLIYNGTGRTAEAVAAFETALALRPDYPEALYNLGVLQIRQDPAAALASLASAQAIRPDSADVLLQLGFAHRELGRLPEARTHFEQALELEPENATARAGLGGTLARQGAYGPAEDALTRALELDPALVEAHYDLGLVLARTGREDSALDSYRRAIELEPEFAPALNNLGIALARRGEGRAALEMLERAVRAAPDFADARFNLGVTYSQVGRPSEGAEQIAAAIALEPENGRYHFALGALLLAGGPNEAAIRHLRRAERLGETLPPELADLIREGS